MTKFITKFVKDESGATAIEYGLIAALIAVAIIASINLMSGELTKTFGKIQASLTAAQTPAAP